jgi:hypothetical protein
MPVEKDQSAWLPEPPPPHPARRDAAIAAALRKFDGVEEAASPPREQPKTSWANRHRSQLAVLVSAMLLVVIGIPAALIGLRNQPSTHEGTPHPAMMHDKEPLAPAPQSAAPVPGPIARVAPANPSPTMTRKLSGPPSATREVASEEPTTAPPAIVETPAPPAPIVEAAPPPPPPPPPAPQAIAGAGKTTSEPMAGNLVVTGSRVARPAVEAPSAGNVLSAGQTYRHFLPKLQAAFRRNDRRAVIRLVDLPLRVNFGTGTQLYRERQSVTRDFDRIFTAKVRQAVLSQRPDSLFVRDQGAMVGDGELWFRETCPNSRCSPLGPIRIVAVNP